MSQPTGQFAVGCVADNSVKYLDQALRLLQSWRWFGGVVAGADFYVCVIDEIDQSYREQFEYYKAHIRIVPRFSVVHPPSNKLRFLELQEIQEADKVLLLDCDTIIVQDPSLLFENKAHFLAKIADMPTVTNDIFSDIFEAVGLELPPQNWQCTVTGESTIPYFNAGVLCFSRYAMVNLVPQWLVYNRKLIDRLDLLGDRSNFCEQASLSLAVTATGFPFEVLGNDMNFPAHFDNISGDSPFACIDPVIIHYHWLIDAAGYLNPSPYPLVNDRIKQFNDGLLEERQSSFYTGNYWVKSSIDESQSYISIYKRELIERIVTVLQPTSILDVGCGDITVGEILPELAYTGIDISGAVTKANKLQFPSREFMQGDFREIDLSKRDFVVCLDMLIQQASIDGYRSIVSKLIKLARIGGVIAGYEAPPSPMSEINFYHEPLSHTMSMAGAINIRQVGAYHQVKVFRFDSPDSPNTKLMSDESELFQPVFIVGTMRSGTTLFADLLGQSEYICHCPFELKDIWSRVAGIPMASAKTRDHECPELVADQTQVEISSCLIDAFTERMEACVDKVSGALFLTKNPHLCNKLPYVQALFPDARYIWIHRHLPQVVASLKRLFNDVLKRQRCFHWWPEFTITVRNRCWNAFHEEDSHPQVATDRIFPGGRVRYLAEYWLESNRAVKEFFAHHQYAKQFVVAEEDLVEDTDGVLAQCLAFLELPLNTSKNVNLDIDVSRNLEWKSLLSQDELNELSDFVIENRNDIDAIFCNEDRATLYHRQLNEA